MPPPAPDEGWHELARDWFVSLAESGQCVWYQPSDWATAKVWAEMLSRQLASGRPSAVMIGAWQTAAGELLTTEGARRRMRLELDRSGGVDEDEEAAVLYIEELKAHFATKDGASPSPFPS